MSQPQRSTIAQLTQQLSEFQQENNRLTAELTQLRQEYERLLKSESRYRQVVENSPLHICFYAADGRFTQVNRAFEQFNGVSFEQLKECNYNIFSDPQLLENGTLPYMQKAFAGETAIEPPTYYDVNRTIPGANLNYGRGHYTPIYNTAGKIEEIVEICVDYTDFFEIQRQLLQERDRAASEKIAILEQTNCQLLERDRILEATASAANALLTIDNFDAAVNTVLKIIGESWDCDRVTVIENVESPSKSSSVGWRILYEWDSPHAVPQIFHPELAQGSYEGIEEWYNLHQRGQGISCLLEEMPEPFRSKQAELGVKALNTVPILIEGKYWGVVGFDDCRETKRRSAAQLAVLRIAADCIGSAIERDRIQRARQEAERNILLERASAAQERSKLLNTVAQVANLLLRSPDYTTVLPDVVRLLGEAVGSDRCEVFQYDQKSGIEEATMQFLAEWWNENVPRSTDIPFDLTSGFPCKNAMQLYEKNVEGEIANFLVDDLQEPLRSIFQAQGNLAVLSVPITVADRWWGAITFDNCREPQLYDEAEIAILKIAADSIAAAIARQAKDDELKRSEALYRSLFEISNEGIYRWQLDQPVPVTLPIDRQVDLIYRYHSVAQANDALAAMYGLAKGEDAIGFRLANFHPQDSKKNRAMMRAIALNGQQIRNAETEEIDTCGQKRYFLNNIISFIENDCVIGGWGTQIDITELRETQQALLQAEQARSHLLTTVTTIANQLLRSPDYTSVLANILQILGEAAKADRCCLVQNVAHPTSGKSAVKMHTEWCRTGIQASIVHTPELSEALLWEYFPEFQEKLVQGNAVNFLVNDLSEPARSILLDQGNISMTLVPIIVQGEFWGVFGFDYCGEVHLDDEADKAIFAIAADSIAAAIERQYIQRSREQWLTATAEAANVLLSNTNLDSGINESLRVIGETIKVDRVEVFQHIYDFTRGRLGFVREIYEWDSPYATRQLLHPELNEFSDDEFLEELWLSLMSGEWWGGVIDELPAPFRDGQVELGVQSTYAVPIFVNSNYWGFIAIDNCCEKKRLSESEIAVFRTAAACIGSAIERDRTQKAILQAEQARSQELERLNAELQQSEERYRLVTLATKEAICDYNIATQQINWYEGLNSPFGHTAEQTSRAVDLDWWLNLIHPDDRDRIERQARIFFEGATDRWLNEYRFQRADGTYAQVLDAGIKARDAQGQPRRVLGAVMDITAQREAEAALHAEIAERRRAEQLARGQSEALVRTLAILAAQPSLENVLHAVLSSIVDGLQFQAGSIWLYEPEAAIVRLNTHSNHPLFAAISAADGLALSVSDEEIAELRSHPFVLHTPAEFAQIPLYQSYESHLAQFAIGSILTVPLVFGDTFLGCLAVCSHSTTDFQIEAIDLACALAHQASLAVQLTALAAEAQQTAIAREREQAAQERVVELSKANEVLKRSLDSLATQPQLDAFLQHIVNEAAAQMGAACGHLFLYDEVTRSLSLSVATDNGGDWQSVPDMEFFQRPIPLNSTAVREFFSRAKTPVICDLGSSDVPYLPGTQEWHQQRHHKRGMCITLQLGERSLGILGLVFQERYTFAPEEIELAQALAQQATLAIELTRLAEQVKQSAVLEERNSIAREIHDTLGQAFTGIIMQLEAANRLFTTKPEQTFACISRAQNLARAGVSQAQRSLWTLWRDAEIYSDLAGNLQRTVAEVAAGTSIPVEFSVQGTPQNLPPNIGMNLLRIGQEALNNALKHAQAQHVYISLTYTPGQVELQVQDDGQGFAPQLQTNSSGFGLMSMQQRAEHIEAKLTVATQPGDGTIVNVIVSLT